MSGSDVCLDLVQGFLGGLELGAGIAAGFGSSSACDAFDRLNTVLAALNSGLVVAHRVHISRSVSDRAPGLDASQVLLSSLPIGGIGMRVRVAAAVEFGNGFGDVGRPATVTGELVRQPITARAAAATG